MLIVSVCVDLSACVSLSLCLLNDFYFLSCRWFQSLTVSVPCDQLLWDIRMQCSICAKADELTLIPNAAMVIDK